MKTRIFLGLALLTLVFAGCPDVPSTVTVPDVVGLSRTQAAEALEAVNLTLGTVTEQNDPDIAHDFVLAQDPAAGTIADSNSAVALTVSLGAEEAGSALFTPGTRVESETESLGTDGGDVSGEVGSSGTAVTVHFPDGALPEDAEVTLAYDTGSITPQEGAPGEALIRLETPGVWYFEEPVEVTFALSAAKAAGTVPVPYLIDEDGDWHVMDLVELDWENLTATTVTYCPTNGSADKADNDAAITWIYAPLSKATVLADCGFRESADGFQIGNQGSDWNPAGECHGMVLFAQWYEDNYFWTDGAFFPRFMSSVDESGLKGQDLIATRAQNASHDAWEAARLQAIAGLYVMTPGEQAASIVNALKNTDDGVVLCLSNGTENSHAVLAYRAESEAGGTRFKIYDPNKPYVSSGRIQDWEGYSVYYDSASGQWQPYGGYSWFLLAGNYGSIARRLRENFDSILEDAEEGFNDSKDAVVTITTHEDGESVFDTAVDIGGRIDSGEMNVEQAWMYVYGPNDYRQKRKMSLSSEGGFLESMVLAEGINRILVVTLGRNAGEHYLIIPNNMTRNRAPLTLECLGAPPIYGVVEELRGLGNPPIPGATVLLYRMEEYVGGTSMDSTTTDDQGAYAFYQLDPGEYVVTAQADGFEIRLGTVEVGEDDSIETSFQLGESFGCHTTGVWGFDAPATGDWPELSVSLNGGYWEDGDGLHYPCDYYTEGGWMTMTWWTDATRTGVAKRLRGVCNAEDGPIEGTYISHLRGIANTEGAEQTYEEFDAVVTSW